MDPRIVAPGTPRYIQNKRRAVPRLTELRRVLAEELPRVLNGHTFDMTVFFEANDDCISDSPPILLECNTTACAAGWGALISPKLRRKGAPRFVKDEHGQWSFQTFDHKGRVELLETFYGLTEEGVNYLFLGGGICGRGEAARLAEIAAIDNVLAEAKGDRRPPEPTADDNPIDTQGGEENG
jgi:hypothetical protein